MIHTSHFEASLICTKCHSGLRKTAEGYICSSCSKAFHVIKGKIFFSEIERREVKTADTSVYRLKNYLKIHHPKFFFLLYNSIALFVGTKALSVAREMPDTALILNVGSGAKRIHPNVVNVDLAPESYVDVVANAYELPFADNVVDLVISESLLEHLERPEAAVKEMHRVLKQGGLLYFVTPFMLGFHSSPNDFYRWTIPGMKILLKDFSVDRAGVAIGPTSAMTAVAREWLAILLSFNSTTLYQLWTMFFMILFIPINWIDLLIARYKMASQIALAYYWIGKKK